MPTYRLQCGFQLDSPMPRDRVYINPVFDIAGSLTEGVDEQEFTDDLAAALDEWTVATQEVQVRMYDVRGSQPVYHVAETVVNPGVVSNSSVPREVALCLSFYAQHNVPRLRGRLFMPCGLLSTGNAEKRPTSTHLDKGQELAELLQAAGGTDADWGVWSKTDGEFHSTTNWWVDDEWDTIRSRGMRSTTRRTGTTSEGG